MLKLTGFAIASYKSCNSLKLFLPVWYLIPVCEDSSSDLRPTFNQMACKTKAKNK